MASACSTASAAACCRSCAVAPTIGAGTCIGTRVAKAGARRQSDADPARQSPFERATTHRYPSGEAAGTGTHRTAAGWKGSILIRRGHDRARLHSCAFPNQPKQPIVPPRDALPEAVAVAKRYEAYLTYQAQIRGASIYPAVQNIILACRALGLGTLITTNHILYEDEIRSILSVPSDVFTFALMPIGYPLGKYGPLSRRRVSEVAYSDRWGEKWAG